VILTSPSSAEVGLFNVVTTSGVGHSPEYYAERLCEKLIHIADTSHPDIRAQALAYKEAMRVILLNGIRQAIVSNHTTVINQLRKAGMNEAAELVLQLRSK
jgi:NAD(P)H-hydrate repair Nnr-like enzyme with NAD(P)H-hydrate dehydratase domain